MLPNMFKIAGELTPTVIHVAARTVATHALSIFGDHSDVMAARPTGWAMLAAGSVQEAHDLALGRPRLGAGLAGAVPALLRRLPHLARGGQDPGPWTTTTCGPWSTTPMWPPTATAGCRPDRPQLRGSAQNPDVFFQAREAANPSTPPCPGSCRASWTSWPPDRPPLRPGRLRRRPPTPSGWWC
jgi:pyruvate-ferredoxin/flavodoxin oxidoreductase